MSKRFSKLMDSLPTDLSANDVAQALRYLSYYGYLGRDEINPATVTAATRAFQKGAGIPANGKLDGKTRRAMAAPRCGFPDARIATAANKWMRKDLTYYVAAYVGGLSKQDQDDLLDLAWKDWMAVADIRIKRTDTQRAANIVISTGKGAAQGFDGPQGTLAWAQLPPGGDVQLLMRFDVDETWIKSAMDRGILFRNVADHEFGHLLGLDHSRVSTALMAPYYKAAIVSPQQVDDIPRIQELYGPATAPPAPPGGSESYTVTFTKPVTSITIAGK